LKLDRLQKFYAILIVILLLAVPYFIVKFQDKPESSNFIPQETEAVPSLPLEQDKSVSRIENLENVFLKNRILKIINLNGKMFFVDSESLTSAEDQKNYPFPAGFSPIKMASNMDDLNLIFLINSNNKIMSWSPVSRKFQDQLIEIPSGSNIIIAKTYLTYLYLLDSNNSQIFRYPRGGNGFGEKVNWLKNNTNLNEISDMALEENLFLVQNGNILKFFQGKGQPFSIESTSTPIEAYKIYTKRNSQNLYALDKKNSRIIKLDLNGNIISQFYNSAISSATDFEVNEDAGKIYFSDSNEVRSFEIK